MRKVTSVILAFCILNFLSGCYTTKSLSINEASKTPSKHDFLVVNIQNRTYELHNYKFMLDHLEGDLFIRTAKYYQYILVTADIADVIINQESPSVFIKIPNENIKGITCHKIDQLKTFGFVVGSVGICVGLLATGMRNALSNIHITFK
jgi:hypothetical protein